MVGDAIGGDDGNSLVERERAKRETFLRVNTKSIGYECNWEEKGVDMSVCVCVLRIELTETISAT